MYRRFKLFKWSHTHDLVMTATMLVFFAFFAQMHDYTHTRSSIQSLAIVISYVMISCIVVYYVYMGRKLHRIVKLSESDPRNFCDRNYLFRENLMSITECAVHPR